MWRKENDITCWCHSCSTMYLDLPIYLSAHIYIYTHILNGVSHCDTTIHGSSNCIGVLSAFAPLHHNSWQLKAEHVASLCGSESYRPRTWSVRCWSPVDWPNHSNPLHQSWPDATSRLQTCQHSTLSTGKLVVVNIALAHRLSNCAPHLHIMGASYPEAAWYIESTARGRLP